MRVSTKSAVALALVLVAAFAGVAVARDLRGNDRANSIEGTDRADRIRGLGGNDELFGLHGADFLAGGAGNDSMQGNDGPDRLSGGSGNDSMTGGRGADRLSGGPGNDSLYGDYGAEPEGDLDPATLAGGPGHDVLEGGQGSNGVAGGTGNDEITAANGARDTIDCGPGNDTAIVDSVLQDAVTGCERVKRRRSRYPRLSPAVGGPTTIFRSVHPTVDEEDLFDFNLQVVVTGPTRACSGDASFSQEFETRLRPADFERKQWCRGTHVVAWVLTGYDGEVGFPSGLGSARFVVR